MFYRPWQTVRPDPARSAALSAALGMPRLVCDVMCARGLDTPEAARAMCGASPHAANAAAWAASLTLNGVRTRSSHWISDASDAMP